jgi:hypothetical protein
MDNLQVRLPQLLSPMVIERGVILRRRATATKGKGQGRRLAMLPRGQVLTGLAMMFKYFKGGTNRRPDWASRQPLLCTLLHPQGGAPG